MREVYENLISRIDGRQVTVLGLGVSNLPLLRLLLSFSCASHIRVYDKKSLPELGEEAAQLAAKGVEFHTGFDKIEGDIIFRSPGIRPDVPALLEACGRGAVLTSEIESVLLYSQAPTFAITGSDGKTTSTTLTGLFVDGAGRRAFVGGNIGTPLLDRLEDIGKSDAVVLELSSFQLMGIGVFPKYAAITNITPNHMDWHTSMAEYEQAKRRIVGEGTERVVLNYENSATRAFGVELLQRGREVIFFSSSADDGTAAAVSHGGAKMLYVHDGVITLLYGNSREQLLRVEDILLPGKHNIENYMTAIGLTVGLVSAEIYTQVAKSFGGVEHRLELVRTLDGVDYYNSSIDSSPTRTVAALSALEGRDIVAICGGYDKNLSYEPLALALCANVRTVVLTGATAGKIKAALLACPAYSSRCPEIIESESFEGAVAKASAAAVTGGCVLLSPASASFDRFKNFAERGRYFKELVQKLQSKTES